MSANDICTLCGAPREKPAPAPLGEKPVPIGVWGKGDWYCSLRCLHGGKALHTIDELIDLVRDAFVDEPHVALRMRDWIMRSLESIAPPPQ